MQELRRVLVMRSQSIQKAGSLCRRSLPESCSCKLPEYTSRNPRILLGLTSRTGPALAVVAMPVPCLAGLSVASPRLASPRFPQTNGTEGTGESNLAQGLGHGVSSAVLGYAAVALRTRSESFWQGGQGVLFSRGFHVLVCCRVPQTDREKKGRAAPS